MRLIPKSLYGRTAILLLAGLILAQSLSAFILLRDRGRILFESVQGQLIERTTGIIRLFNTLPMAERNRLLPLLSGPEFRLALTDIPLEPEPMDEDLRQIAQTLQDQLARRLDQTAVLRVSLAGTMMNTPHIPRYHTTMMEAGMQEHWRGMHGPHAMVGYFRIQVQLQDGSWIRFERGLSEQLFDWPFRLLAALGVLLISVLILSLLGVRMIVRPLTTLKDAAESLGKDIHQPPLRVSGPTEVMMTAKAFNTMQQRLKNYIDDRSRILAAISHDLKTPLTRIRLRADLLDEEELRSRTQRDIDEMEAMVNSTLDFMRGTETNEPSCLLDLSALLESILDDATEAGQQIALESTQIPPIHARPLALKRCIVNLVNNAIRYGDRAEIRVTNTEEELVISICDHGPGVPEEILPKLFEPFYRLESSRARQTGGTGLGLGIARNIARAHGGDLILRNRSKGGLCAEISIPR